MARIVVFGNSGSGKTTFARARAEALDCAHLDLDSVAWEPNADAPTRRPLAQSQVEIHAFIDAREKWIVEGCYADLIELVAPHADELVFLNPGTDTCVQNARNRPWEPDKYVSPEAQDANLEMLVDWIQQYETRDDEFSLAAHRRIYDSFPGRKREFRSNAGD